MQDSSLRVIFAGTPAFAAEYLTALLGSKHQVIAVYTQPDRPAGRGKKLTASPVKSLALENQLPVFQPASLRNAEAQRTLADLAADVMVVVAYGLILPQSVLDLPRYGCLNVHASLLPRWRGAAPIQRAIEAGDRETGVTIMQMEAGLDTGPMLATARCPIGPDDTAATLFERLAQLGKEPLLAVLDQLAREGEVTAKRQDESKATYASKIEKSEAALDWQHDAELIHRQIRAFNPFPVAYTQIGDQRLKIYRATVLSASSASAPPSTLTAVNEDGVDVQCGRGVLRLQEIQLPGKRPMMVKDLLRGNRSLFVAGEQLQS